MQCETGSNSPTSTECSRENHGIFRTLELGHQKDQDLGAAPISRMIHSGAISSSADLTIETGGTAGRETRSNLSHWSEVSIPDGFWTLRSEARHGANDQ